MKLLFASLVFMLSQQVHAASTLTCQAEDGTVITATEDSETKTELFDIKVSIRGERVKSYPNAFASVLEDRDGKINFMVITDPSEGILLVVKDSTLIDKTGVYEVEICEIGI